MTSSNLQMTFKVTCDLEDDPQVFAIQISHVWYQNDGLNETKLFKVFSALQMTTSDFQITSEVTCDLKGDPQVFAIQISHVWYKNDGLNGTQWF